MIPLFGDSPVEMGLRTQAQIEERLRAIEYYVVAFAEAFPREAEPVNLLNLRKALEAFQRTLISGRSAYDRWARQGDTTALGPAAVRGLALFSSARTGCAVCHSGFNFSDHVNYAGAPSVAMPYHNIGLYNLDGQGAYPEPNTGAFDVTLEPIQMGAFKAPTLRNIAVTAPYMHDGSVATLGEVIDIFAAGGRNIASGPLAGDGRTSPLKDPLVHGFSLSLEERADLIALLESLTDDEFLLNPKFANPWP
jgi:cytochrome c peroxidase